MKICENSTSPSNFFIDKSLINSNIMFIRTVFVAPVRSEIKWIAGNVNQAERRRNGGRKSVSSQSSSAKEFYPDPPIGAGWLGSSAASPQNMRKLGARHARPQPPELDDRRGWNMELPGRDGGRASTNVHRMAFPQISR